MRSLLLGRLLATLATLALPACGSPTAPSTNALVPGQYVLTDIGGQPAPLVLSQTERADGTVSTRLFSYDTLPVIDDSTARRHVRQVTLEQPAGGTATEAGSEETTVQLRLLSRDDEFLLIGPAVFSLGPTYFAVRGSDLIQRLPLTRARCTPDGCTYLSNTIVEARYVRH